MWPGLSGNTQGTAGTKRGGASHAMVIRFTAQIGKIPALLQIGRFHVGNIPRTGEFVELLVFPPAASNEQARSVKGKVKGVLHSAQMYHSENQDTFPPQVHIFLRDDEPTQRFLEWCPELKKEEK
jgi:hypothetical protein